MLPWPSPEPTAPAQGSHMKDEQKSRAQLIAELETLRQQVTDLEADVAERQALAAALEASEARYRQIFASNLAVKLIIDPTDGRIMDANEAACRFYGYDAETLTALRISDINTLSEAEVKQEMTRAKTEKRLFFNFRHRLASGEIRDVEVYSGPVETPQGTFLYSIIHDVTARHRAEAELRQSQTNLSALIENTDGSIWSIDRNYRLIVSNSAIQQRVRDLTGQSFTTGDTALTENIPPAFRKRWRGYYDRALGGEQFTEAVEFHAGDTEYHIEYRFSPIRAADGAVTGVTVFGRDITERKQAERALQEAEWRYRTVADFTYDWEIWENPDQTLRYVSPACERLTGYTVAEFMADSTLFNSLIVAEDRDGWEEHRHDVMETPGPYEFQFRIRRRDGQIAWIEHVCHPVTDGGGVFLGYRASNRDVTKRKRVEEALLARTRELTLLNETGQAFAFSLDLDQVLITVLSRVRQIIDIAACSIWLVDRESGELVCREAASPRAELVRGQRLAAGQGLVGWVVRQGQSLNIPDIRQEPRYFKGIDEQTGLSVRSILGVPLQTKSDSFGALQLLAETENRFSPDDVRLAESLATLAAIAIDNARLYRQTQEDAAAKALLLREVNHRVKNNLAAITGMLYVERRHAKQTNTQRAYVAIMDDLINRVRGLSKVHQLLSAANWSPLPLDNLTEQIIKSALQAVPPDREVGLEVTTSAPVVVTPKEAHNLALAINELSTNVVKYAALTQGKSHIRVDIEPDGDQQNVQLTFRDNGPGFPAAVLEAQKRNVGLYLVENAVCHSLRGDITLQNDNGAVVIIRFARELV